MHLGCVDAANGYGICTKKMCCFYHKKPSRYQCILKLPFQLYIYCTLVAMRLHTGWNHSPTKAQTTSETFHTVYSIKELRTGVSIDQKDGGGTLFNMIAFWELLLPSPMCCVIVALYTLHSTLHTLYSTLYTLNSTLYTLHSTLHTLHSTLYTPHSTHDTRLYTLHSTLHTLHSTLYHFTLYTPHFALHPLPHSTVYSALVR